jgi:hypothetical protein
MKKLGFAIAALATIALAAPSIANAETIVIKRGGMHHHHWDRGYHRDWHHSMHRDWHRSRDRVVIRHRD